MDTVRTNTCEIILNDFHVLLGSGAMGYPELYLHADPLVRIKAAHGAHAAGA